MGIASYTSLHGPSYCQTRWELHHPQACMDQVTVKQDGNCFIHKPAWIKLLSNKMGTASSTSLHGSSNCQTRWELPHPQACMDQVTVMPAWIVIHLTGKRGKHCCQKAEPRPHQISYSASHLPTDPSAYSVSVFTDTGKYAVN